jgi:WD40 repeat protein
MQNYTRSLVMRPTQQHTAYIGCVQFSPDEKQLLTQSSDGTAKVWDAQEGSLLLTFPVYGGASRLCCFSPCGGLVVSSSADGSDLTLLRASDASVVATAESAFNGASVMSACFSPDGARLAVGFDSGGVRLFSVPGLDLLSSLPRAARDDYVNSLAFTGDGNTLLVAADEHVETWGVAPGEEPLLRHTLREGWAWHASVSPDSKHAAVGGQKEQPTCVWDLASGARVLQLAADPEDNTVSVC